MQHHSSCGDLQLRSATLQFSSIRFGLIVVCAVCLFTQCDTAAASTLCVNTDGTRGCYATIQAAVNHASPRDVIQVNRGTYKEYVTVGIPLSILGPGANHSIIDATNLPHGIFVDGFDNAGLNDVTIAGLTVRNAQLTDVR